MEIPIFCYNLEYLSADLDCTDDTFHALDSVDHFRSDVCDGINESYRILALGTVQHIRDVDAALCHSCGKPADGVGYIFVQNSEISLYRVFFLE